MRHRARHKLDGQRRIFTMAKRKARQTGKPLIVVGDPAPPRTLNSAFGAGYDGGDVCIDINGCGTADPTRTLQIKARIQDALRTLPDNSAVIFESEVLEYLQPEDLKLTITDLWRVSGGDLFCAHSNVIDLSAYATTGQRQEPSVFRVWRVRKFGVMMRVFTAFPPFHNFRYIEYSDKKIDRKEAETYHMHHARFKLR